MSYGGSVRVLPQSERTGVPDLHVLRHQDGEEPDICDRLVDLIDRIDNHVRRHAAGEQIPLLEQLDLEREKVDVLGIVGVDARWVQDTRTAAQQRVIELTEQLLAIVEGTEGHGNG